MNDTPDSDHQRPADLDDDTVKALGKLSEALEMVEEARGRLYGFHRLTGSADLTLGEAIELLKQAGHTNLADDIAEDLLGRNVLGGRWTFQLVEEYDDGYYRAFRAHEEKARSSLAEGRRHLFEAEMKENRRTKGRPSHEASPAD